VTAFPARSRAVTRNVLLPGLRVSIARPERTVAEHEASRAELSRHAKRATTFAPLR
jgi:hypothetical protein